MLTDLIFEAPGWEQDVLVTLVERAATATLSHLSLSPEVFEIAVLACDDARIASLNADFRGKPTPTNVLSWPEQDLSADTEGSPPDSPMHGSKEDPHPLGDIAIAYETCAREARALNKPFDDHVTHLIVHGVLHLLGYDHIRDKDATLMEAKERAILGKMGLADPYMEI